MKFLKAGVIAAIFSTASFASADTFSVDGVHSMSIFKIGHYGIGHVYGRFNQLSGTITTDEAGLPTNVFLEIAAESVDTAVEARDNHLRSPDFLNAAQYPTLSFTSTAVRALEEANHFEIDGVFSLHGTEQEITVVFERTGLGEDPHGNVRLGAEGSFEILRSNYGMNGLLETVGDRVRIELTVEAIQQ